MSVALPAPPLLVITDRLSASRPLFSIVEDVLQAGCRWLMVREKDLGAAELSALSRAVVAQARPYDARIVVNGAPDAAQAAGAAGVHVQSLAQARAARERLGESALVGLSVHGLEEARAAAAAGADYVTMSPVFPTDSKPGYGPALGTEALAAICRQLEVPVIALAGITPANARACIDAGAAAVAVMGTIMRSDDPGTVARDLLQAIGHRTPAL